MALVWATGFDFQDGKLGSGGGFGTDGAEDGVAFNTYSTTDKRPGTLGTASVTFPWTSQFNGLIFQLTAGLTANGTHFFRLWFKVGALPILAARYVTVMEFQNRYDVAIDASGHVLIFDRMNGASATTVLATSSTTPAASNTWAKYDITVVTDGTTAANNKISVSVDGVAAVSNVALATTMTYPSDVRIGGGYYDMSLNGGWGLFSTTQSGTSFYDDFTWRDNSGTVCNTAPSDAEQLSPLLPTSDSAAGNWTTGGGATTGLSTNVDNVPPVGAATAAAGTQIKNASKTVPSTYTATCTVSASVTAGSTALGIFATAHLGSPQNKTQLAGNVVVNGTAASSANVPLAAQAAWPSGWFGQTESITFAASTAVAGSYTLGVTKQTSSTSELDCCALFGYLLSLAPTPTLRYVAPRVVGQAVARAGNW